MNTVTFDPVPGIVLTAVAAYVAVTLNLASRSRRQEKTHGGRGDPGGREPGYDTMRVRPRTAHLLTIGAPPNSTDDKNRMDLAA